jgi:hypothetical protein
MLQFKSRGNHEGFEAKLVWPGRYLGINGLGLAGTAPAANGWVSVRVYAGLHSAYSMAAARKDAVCTLKHAVPNLMALMGLCHGHVRYHCHLHAGYQGAIVAGGACNKRTGFAPEHPEADFVVRHYEAGLAGRDAFETSLQERAEALQSEIDARILAAGQDKVRATRRKASTEPHKKQGSAAAPAGGVSRHSKSAKSTGRKPSGYQYGKSGLDFEADAGANSAGLGAADTLHVISRDGEHDDDDDDDDDDGYNEEDEEDVYDFEEDEAEEYDEQGDADAVLGLLFAVSTYLFSFFAVSTSLFSFFFRLACACIAVVVVVRKGAKAWRKRHHMGGTHVHTNTCTRIYTYIHIHI